MTEVMVSLVVFVIAVVGLVATQQRGMEAENAARELREAERIANATMSELMSKGYQELMTRSFTGTLNPTLPYSDPDTAPLVRDFRAVPVENPTVTAQPGRRSRIYAVWRTVQQYPATAQPAVDPNAVVALQFRVIVMWIDDTNSAFPAPASATVASLRPDFTDPNSTNFKPWARSVDLRTIRANDAGAL
jgi:type II secretory pathway pseudopilin PulG